MTDAPHNSAPDGEAQGARAPAPRGPFYHFHISKTARERLNFGAELFATSGNVIFVDLHAVRVFTRRVNEVRRARGDSRLITAGDTNAMGLIDEVLHYVSRLYAARTDPAVFNKALAFVKERAGEEAVDGLLLRFTEEFPPREVWEGKRTAAQYIGGSTEGISHREIALEELLHLWLADSNPAFASFKELLDHAPLNGYQRAIAALGEFFSSQPVFGPDNQDLVTMLRAPASAFPGSLSGQLEFIRSRWGYLLGDLLLKLLMGIDLIREEEKLRAFGPGQAVAYEYAGQYAEPEAFSADKDWMPKVVMIAKNALVWLDQLSRRYGRGITRLDQIPDEELDRLSRWGITALWLIGVWERSAASRKLKKMMGNPDAEASAYSLFDYTVAWELGGEDALRNLKDRAWRRGIRLASDMVPNHTGIDSRWMIEHPDRFLVYPRPYPPFPSYSFNGESLAQDQRVGVFLEDHYYSKSDAAVVFKRVDFHTGDARYIYHGNDGTHMPWNDTAQLDFLNPETRHAVMDTILHVASLFPIIRFDAAMTLTKKHYQRLWFPEPGRGGDIPSRAECAISRFDFDHAMPKEFWREVVDRVAREAPDTLLLAEAFWLLEGFFVRTLGMHRVYNSAFMNMLKAEDNANYRTTIKNTLEFDPQVLKRFVNFMSNPDEDTAIAQFGDGDKYFGVCVLMATMPGLPMFAHGQVEGFGEKYGMEFRRAYRSEEPNGRLVERHEREIFPLLWKRRLFSDVENFLLYDLYDAGGWVNEDVFAYSNGSGAERALVAYNNRFKEAKGRIRVSTAYSVKTRDGKALVQRTLAEGLTLAEGEDVLVVFREHPSGLEYIRRCTDIRESGMYIELRAYGYQVFMGFRCVADDSAHRWSRLLSELGGRGVPDMDAALKEMDLRPILEPFRKLVSADACRALLAGAPAETIALLSGEHARLARAARERGADVDPDQAARSFASFLEAAGKIDPGVAEPAFLVMWAWAVLRSLCPSEAGARSGEPEPSCPAASWIDEWMLAEPVRRCAADMGWSAEGTARSPSLLAVTLECGKTFSPIAPAEFFARAEARDYLRVNEFGGVRWFHKESFESLLRALMAVRALASAAGAGASTGKRDAAFAAACIRKAEASGYRWDEFLDRLEAQTSGTAATARPRLSPKKAPQAKKASSKSGLRRAPDSPRKGPRTRRAK